MAVVIVGNVPASTSDAKLHEFFAFCGTVKDVDRSDPLAVRVAFASATAVQTALLLDGADLDGSTLSVKVAGGESSADDLGAATPEDRDISQEHKPKLAILAQYLSHGYKFLDQVIQRAIDYDKQHGVLTRFQAFLANLDLKTHAKETTANLDTKLQVTLNLSKGWDWMSKYIDLAKQTDTGSRIHKFYSEVEKSALDVHGEAKRLAGLGGLSAAPAETATATSTASESAVPPAYSNAPAVPPTDSKIQQ